MMIAPTPTRGSSGNSRRITMSKLDYSGDRWAVSDEPGAGSREPGASVTWFAHSSQLPTVQHVHPRRVPLVRMSLLDHGTRRIQTQAAIRRNAGASSEDREEKRQSL